MLINKASEREWMATHYPGIERSLFRHNEEGGRSSLVRLTQGAHFPRHLHLGGEEVLVLDGRVAIDGVASKPATTSTPVPGRNTTWWPCPRR